MFFKGFICGWVGMATVAMILIWGMTPRLTGTAISYEPTDSAGFVYQDC